MLTYKEPVFLEVMGTHHKYPGTMPNIVLFTMTSGVGTCTSTRTSTRPKCPQYSFYNNFWPGYLLHSELLKELNIYIYINLF